MREKKDVLQPVDADARRLAKTLIHTARSASIATLEADGFPATSRVNIATMIDGRIGFLISGLSGHFANLARDRRCSLLIGEPGKGDALAHARITLIGRAERLHDGDERAALRARYLMCHPKGALYVDFGDFAFWSFETERAALNGGFGKAYALTAGDLATATAGPELTALERDSVAHMNTDHADAIDRIASRAGCKGTGWRLACIDAEGLDLVHGEETARIWFDIPLRSVSELRPVLVALSKA
jgi:putative heme iron utilization protein